ncbi:MAG: hypothetical protein NTW87_28605 [Planctomycetota bacterium]|nr:hypothetical protein [Planctomycetota bacterium]
MKAGFAEVDITPPVGTRKIGWLKLIIGERVADPLFARAAVFECGTERVAFIQLDTLSIRRMDVNDLRKRIETAHGFPGSHIMVAATHNHAGPAVCTVGDVAREDAYVEGLLAKIVVMFGAALANRQSCSIGFGRALEWRLAHNRRVVTRSGLVRTHGRFSDEDALFFEGPIDPEVNVLAARNGRGELLGALVNYACHPTHYGGETVFSAGFPGALARIMKERGCPVTLFLNGTQGNVHTSDPAADGADVPLETAGRLLADDAWRVIPTLKWRGKVRIASDRRVIKLPFRKLTRDQIKGTATGAQRFIDSAIYDRGMPEVVAEIKARGKQLAEVQVFFMDEYAFASIPAEMFVELGLKLKQLAHPIRAWVVGVANGMVGYVPHKEAFARGGYETTFFSSSKLAPEAGDMLVRCAASIIKKGRRR